MEGMEDMEGMGNQVWIFRFEKPQYGEYGRYGGYVSQTEAYGRNSTASVTFVDTLYYSACARKGAKAGAMRTSGRTAQHTRGQPDDRGTTR